MGDVFDHPDFQDADPALVRRARRMNYGADQVAQCFYTGCYCQAWVECLGGDSVDATIERLVSTYEIEEEEELEGVTPSCLSSTIHYLIDDAPSVDEFDTSGESYYVFCIAVAHAIMGREPLFPRWFTPEFLDTLAGRSDWKPESAEQILSDDWRAVMRPDEN